MACEPTMFITKRHFDQQLQALAKLFTSSLQSLGNKLMTDITVLQTAVDTLTHKVTALVDLTNTLHTDLVSLQSGTEDPAQAAVIQTLINKITSANAQIDAAITADTPAAAPAPADPTTSTSSAPAV